MPTTTRRFVASFLTSSHRQVTPSDAFCPRSANKRHFSACLMPLPAESQSPQLSGGTAFAPIAIGVSRKYLLRYALLREHREERKPMRAPRRPLCHPDQPYYAKDLCRSCYNRQRTWGHRLSLVEFEHLAINQKRRCCICQEIRTLSAYFEDDRPMWLWCIRCRALTTQLQWILRRYRGDWAMLQRVAHKRLGVRPAPSDGSGFGSGYDPDDDNDSD